MEDASPRERTDPVRIYIYDVGGSISSGVHATEMDQRSWKSPLPEKDTVDSVDMELKLGDGCGGDYTEENYLECYSPDFSRKLGTASARDSNVISISFLSTGAIGQTAKSFGKLIEVLGEVKQETGFVSGGMNSIELMSYLPDGRFLYVSTDPSVENKRHIYVDGQEVLTKTLTDIQSVLQVRVDDQGNWALLTNGVSEDGIEKAWLHPDGSETAEGPADPPYGEMDQHDFLARLPETRDVLATPGYQYNGSIVFEAHPPAEEDQKLLFILPDGASAPVEALKLTKSMKILYFGKWMGS